MMRQVRCRNAQLFLDLSHHHAVGVGGKQELHDAEARLGPHGGEHVGVAGCLFHSSVIIEIWNLSSEMWRTHFSIMPQTLPNMGNAAEVAGQTPWSARDASSRRTCTNGGAVPLDRGRRPRRPARCRSRCSGVLAVPWHAALAFTLASGFLRDLAALARNLVCAS